MSAAEYIKEVEDLKLRAKVLNETALEILNSSDCDWSVCKQTGNICIKKLSQNSNLGHKIVEDTESKTHVFKGECLVPLSRDKAKILLHPDGAYRMQWEPLSSNITKVLPVDETSCVYRHEIRPQLMGLISARDSIDICSFYTNDKMSWIVLGGTDYPEMPQVDKIVRVWTHISACFITDTNDPNICKVTSLMHTDLRIPVIPLALIENSLPGSNLLFLQEFTKAHSLMKDQQTSNKNEAEINKIYWNFPAEAINS